MKTKVTHTHRNKGFKTLMLFCFINFISITSFSQTNILPTTGDVGIGTLTPSAKLDVNGNMIIDSSLIVKDSLNVKKRLTVDQDIKVVGKSVFVDDGKFKADLKVLGVGKFKDKLVVDGLTRMNGDAKIFGDLKIKSLENLTLTENRFLSLRPNGKVISLNKASLINAIYQPLQTCKVDINGNILSVWKQTPNPNYGILFTGTDCPARVGIGLDNPITTLDVNGSITMRSGVVAGYIPVSNANGTMVWTDPAAIDDGDWTVTTTDLYRASGNVGIGTTSPTTTLDLVGNFRYADGTEGYKKVLISDATGIATWQDASLIDDGDWTINGLDINRVFGRVGVGTNTPEDKFQVGANSTKLVIGKASGVNLGHGTSYIGFNASRELGRWKTGTDLAHDGGAIIYGDVFGSLIFATLPYTGTIGQSGINDADVVNNIRLFIHRDGNVGIGTQKVVGYKLSVEGFIRAREIDVNLDTWSDFVFYDDYQLKPLNEVEKFINKNKHLPDVPSEKEVLANGVSLGKMNAILLQKVEENTLYIIAMNKRMEQLEKENQALKKSFKK